MPGHDEENPNNDGTEDVIMEDAVENGTTVVSEANNNTNNNNNTDGGGGGRGNDLDRQQRQQIIVESIYKDLVRSVCVDVASNMHKLIKTTGELPPPGRLLVPPSNTKSLLRTLEQRTGIAARREIYPELYGPSSLSSTAAAAAAREEVAISEETSEEQITVKSEGVQVEEKAQDGDNKVNTAASTQQQSKIVPMKSNAEIKQLLRQYAVETPVTDLLEGRLKRPFSATGSGNNSSNSGQNNNAAGDSVASGAAATGSTTAGGDTSAPPTKAVNGTKSSTKFKPDPESDSNDDDEDDDDDDDDEEYKLEDDEDDKAADDEDDQVLLKKKRKLSTSSIVSSSSSRNRSASVSADQQQQQTMKPSDATTTNPATSASSPSAGPGSTTVAPIPTDIEDSANIVTPDIWGNHPPKEPKNFYCVCSSCNRQISTSRFASHLDKCMGLSTRPLTGGGSSTRG